MPHFEYTVKDPSGKTIKGNAAASSRNELLTILSKRKLVAISLKEINEPKKRESKLSSFFKGRHIGTLDLNVFCKQLASMINGGVPIIRAIDAIDAETKNPVLKSTLMDMSRDIRSGESFSGSIKKFPHIFSPLFVAIVEAGEKVGSLHTMLERLSNYLTARDRINKKLLSAISYPSVVIVFFILAMGVVTIVIIPRFKGLYKGLGAGLPPITQMVFGTSDFVMRYSLFVIIGVALAAYLLYKFVKTKNGRRAFDGLLLKIPVFGDVVKKAAMSKFARTLSTLIGQGIPVPEALSLVGRTSGNTVLEDASLRLSKLIVDGDKIPDAFKKVELFPPLLVQMSAIGVEAGNLPELLNKAADFYEDEVDAFISIMSAMIEPILIIVLGIILGFVIVALYMPIFKLSQAVSGKMM